MQATVATFGTGFYFLLIAVIAGLAFLWKQFFKRKLKSDLTATMASFAAALLTAPIIFLIWLRLVSF